MDALKFVLKTLIFTMLMVVFMQVKVGGNTIEEYSYRWLKTSSVSQYLQATAAGGAMALKNLGQSLKTTIKRTASGFEEGAHEKAIR